MYYSVSNQFYQFSHSGSYVNPIGPTRVISLKFRLVISLLYFKNTVSPEN